MMLLFDDTMCFPNLFREELLSPPRPAEVDRILAELVPPETLMVAFADVPAAMLALVSIIIDALPPAAAFADASAMTLDFVQDTCRRPVLRGY
jgi:hypothetical protein